MMPGYGYSWPGMPMMLVGMILGIVLLIVVI